MHSYYNIPYNWFVLKKNIYIYIHIYLLKYTKLKCIVVNRLFEQMHAGKSHFLVLISPGDGHYQNTSRRLPLIPLCKPDTASP